MVGSTSNSVLSDLLFTVVKLSTFLKTMSKYISQYIDKQMNSHNPTDMLLKMAAQSSALVKCHPALIINDNICR